MNNSVDAIMARVESAGGAAYAYDGMEPVINYRALREILIAALPPVAEPATEDAGEPVAWAVQLEDGTIGGFGWASMDTYPTVRKIATLREGCSYVFAYRCDSIQAPRVTGGRDWTPPMMCGCMDEAQRRLCCNRDKCSRAYALQAATGREGGNG